MARKPGISRTVCSQPISLPVKPATSMTKLFRQRRPGRKAQRHGRRHQEQQRLGPPPNGQFCGARQGEWIGHAHGLTRQRDQGKAKACARHNPCHVSRRCRQRKLCGSISTASRRFVGSFNCATHSAKAACRGADFSALTRSRTRWRPRTRAMGAGAGPIDLRADPAQGRVAARQFAAEVEDLRTSGEDRMIPAIRP